MPTILRPLFLVLLAVVARQADAATDWNTCPSKPWVHGEFNALLVLPGDNLVVAQRAYLEQTRAFERWCGEFVRAGSSMWPEKGIVNADYLLCRRGGKPKPWDASFPAVPGVVIWCGSGGPASSAVAAAAASGAPPAKAVLVADDPAPRCSDRDIEGNWTRRDGAVAVIGAMRLNGGGNAIMRRHPAGWPPTAYKFSGIRLRDGCSFEARCHSVHRNGGNGGYNTTETPCVLELDKASGTLRAPGNHGIYRR